MPDPRPGHFARFLDLTRMQRRVVILMAHDMTNFEMMEHLEVSHGTIKAHACNARRRNLVKTNTALVARLLAENEGRIPPKPPPRSEWVRR